jgi:hypothetical protein
MCVSVCLCACACDVFLIENAMARMCGRWAAIRVIETGRQKGRNINTLKQAPAHTPRHSTSLIARAHDQLEH